MFVTCFRYNYFLCYYKADAAERFPMATAASSHQLGFILLNYLQKMKIQKPKTLEFTIKCCDKYMRHVH